MANDETDASKEYPTYCEEFAAVPVRHRQILDKLARCRFCGHLCCCIDHCMLHESKHTPMERARREGIRNTPEWIEASESLLQSLVVKNEFPFLCIYCKLKVKDELHLRYLMQHSLCPIKKYHWMIPISMCDEGSKRESHNESSAAIESRRSFQRARYTPKKTPEKSLLRTALRNSLSVSLRTLLTDRKGALGPFTSTPESSPPAIAIAEESTAAASPEAASPTTPKTLPAEPRSGILSMGQRSRPRPQNTPRRVAFAKDEATSPPGGLDGKENLLDGAKASGPRPSQSLLKGDDGRRDKKW